MSEWKDRLLYPPLYVIILIAAVYFVYQAFSIGLEKGEYAGKYEPHVEAGPPPSEEETYDLAEMLEPTDELLGMGEELYNINCASCHGADGQGNGPKGAGLNPPPRNFVSGEEFKQGGGTLQIYETLNTGVPGSSMASFSFLNPQELMALAHYVRSFMPDPPSDPASLVQELAPGASQGAAAQQPAAGADSASVDSAAASSDTTTQPAAAAEGPSLPLEFAVERILSEPPVDAKPVANLPEIYTLRCATCHGPAGRGAIVKRTFPNVGEVYAPTRPLSAVNPGVITDSQAFASFLSSGIPGQPGHSFPELTAEQIARLYEALKSSSGN